MPKEKFYAGGALRAIRTRLGLTQKDFAAKLSVSLPYFNQMENNNRPLSRAVATSLATEFEIDMDQLGASDTTRLATKLQEALADPRVATTPPSLSELRLAAAKAPTLADALLGLHQRFGEAQDRLSQLETGEGAPNQGSWEDVRQYFEAHHNYIAPIEEAAERFASRKGGPSNIRVAALSKLGNAGVRVAFSDGPELRLYDPATKTLHLARDAPNPTQTFQLLVQVAHLRQDALLQATLDQAGFQTEASRALAKQALANVFAGAAMMPYAMFLDDAQTLRHDIERLGHRYGASIEQVAHRLTSLQRPGAKGVPFFFARVDRAGNLSKQLSALPDFAFGAGGTCPLWNLHHVFETPERFVPQLAETPDRRRYLSVARTLTKRNGAFNAPLRSYAIALVCDHDHAHTLVYADNMGLEDRPTFDPIGTSCQICPRAACPQRAMPSLSHVLMTDPHRRGFSPYEVN